MTAVVLTSFAAADLCRRFGTYSVYVCSLFLASIIPWVNAFAAAPLTGGAFCALLTVTRACDGVVTGLTEVAGIAMLLRVSPDPQVMHMPHACMQSTCTCMRMHALAYR